MSKSKHPPQPSKLNFHSKQPAANLRRVHLIYFIFLETIIRYQKARIANSSADNVRLNVVTIICNQMNFVMRQFFCKKSMAKPISV